jgi:hypothetical protein
MAAPPSYRRALRRRRRGRARSPGASRTRRTSSQVRLAMLHLGFGRIVASEIEVLVTLVHLL